MARRNNMPFSPMSWHLVFTLIKLIEASGESLHKRMNLISEIIGDLVAKKNGMKREKETPTNKELEDRLDILMADFLFLRESYQPTIENQEFIYGKQGDFETSYDCILNEIKSIIEEFPILDQDQVKEIMLSGEAHSKMNGGPL